MVVPTVEHFPVEDNGGDALHVRDAWKRFAVQNHQVRELPDLHCADLLGDPHGLRRPFRGALEYLHGREPSVLDQNLHLVMHRRTWRGLVTAVGADQHSPTSVYVHPVESQRIAESALAALPHLRTRVRWIRVVA